MSPTDRTEIVWESRISKGSRDRIAVLGGTFDPIHNGHLQLAQITSERFGLDAVIFVPAAMNPLKQEHPGASNEDRFNMVSLAITEFPSFFISRFELDRPPPSFTIDTISALKGSAPNSSWYLLLGSDNISDLHRWSRFEEILSIVEIVPVVRVGYSEIDWEKLGSNLGDNAAEIIRHNLIQTAPDDVTATDIREALSFGEIPDGLLPEKVADYIAVHRLYVQ